MGMEKATWISGIGQKFQKTNSFQLRVLIFKGVSPWSDNTRNWYGPM